MSSVLNIKLYIWSWSATIQMRIFEQYFMGCCHCVCLSSGPVRFQVQLEKFSKFEAHFEVVEGYWPLPLMDTRAGRELTL